MTTTNAEPAVWIGCLECYNAGGLVGEWYPATAAAGVTTGQVHGREIRPGTHEELWVMDHEGLPIRGECSPGEAQECADVLAEVDEWQRPALLAWVESGDYVAQGTGDFPSIGDFEERFVGEWSSFEDYATNLAEDTALLANLPEEISCYFDWSAWTRNLAFDYVTQPVPSGGVFVFRSL